MKEQIMNVLADVTKTGTKIKTNEYRNHGLYPIVDQSQDFISGYTDDKTGLATDDPYIIFGDHTCCVKFVEFPLFLGADGVKLLKVTNEGYAPKYVYYSLLFRPIESKEYSRHFKAFKERTIKVRCLEDQAKVVNDLDNINECLIQKRKQITELDGLVKSRFMEMFGDKGFSEKPLAEYCFGNGAYGAQSASAPFQEGRPRYVRITDINDDGSLNDDVVCSINESDDMDYKLEYGDFLFARMGATVGKTYAFITGNQIYAGYCIRFKLDTSKINPRYLFWLTKQENYWRWVRENQSGAAQPGINAKKYGSLPVPNAPIDLQNQFASFVELIDKSRFVCHSRNFL
ncbi:MAG: hypothetical protein K5762_06705 [Bacilli bacterium]|nr:hypothetical protein [Bacilli bacterium]